MKLLFDAEAIRYPLTGIGRYAFELSRQLLMHEAIESIHFARQFQLTTTMPSCSSSHSGGASVSLINRLQNSDTVRSAYHHLSSCWLSSVAKRVKPDVYHAPSFITKKLKLPTVVTIHDFSFYHYPAYHLSSRVTFMKKHLPDSIDRADHIVTDSEFVKNELIHFYPQAANKVSAIPLGVDQRFKPKSHQEVADTLNQFGLRYQSYLLSVSTVEPRKNIAGLIKAYSLLPFSMQKDFPLVLVGHSGWLSEDVHTAIKQLKKKGVIHYLGYLPDELLPDVYAGAKCFVFPSFYEGFGLPVLEAMASGLPVIVADSSALKEVAGGVGLFVDPNDVEEMADTMMRVCQQSNHEEVVRQGLERAAMFSWQVCAENMMGVYRGVVGRG